MVLTSLQCDGLDVKNDSAAVALGAEKAFERMLDAELGDQQGLGEAADGAGADLERDLARAAELGDLRFV
ncbi:MAG TPA: hypothetical protein VGK95_05815, partial [Caldimonas sp.]